MRNRKKQAVFTHNLAGSPLTELAQAFLDLASTLESVRQPFRARRHVGRYNDCTVYEVKETTVQAHKRRGFVAVRILRKPRN